MILVERVSKRYLIRQGWRTILHDINFRMEKGEKIGIPGHNDAGKSTLIRLISGVKLPVTGEIKRTMSISWPLAFSGAFRDSLIDMDNSRFICRIYDVDINYVKNFTEEFSELGQYPYKPVKCYSSGVRVCLALALSPAVGFDYHPIDEVITVGGSCFADKCKHELSEKCKDHSIILVSYSYSAMKQHCDNAVVLEKGCMYQFEDMNKAYEYCNSLP